MKLIAPISTIVLLFAFSLHAQDAKTVAVKRFGSEPVTKGSAKFFTGNVRIYSWFRGKPPSRIRGATVAFAPGARTAWHTHPLGQTLSVTAGEGWVQQWGGPVQVIRRGDTVWIPPGVKHWHGATASKAMTHIAIVETLNGKSVEWMEQVTADQYRK
jgi:quercetin dioxygenase-like cupin family protein